MLAQWISWAHRDGFTRARTEPLITLGSAPLDISDFASVVLGQLGESRLATAIDADIAGVQAHARALDADSKGAVRDIHRRVGTTMLFESSGGQVERVAHLPELRFALGEPSIDTTSVDTAAMALEERSYFLRRVGTDGYRISYRPTIKKVVNDRRASLDEEGEIQPALRNLVKDDFDRGASIPRVCFPADAASIPDTPRLTLVVMDPEAEWTGTTAGDVRKRIAQWTRARGASPRLYPGALVWAVKKPGRELREKVEQWLAWKRVAREISAGTLGSQLDSTELADIRTKVREAGDAAREEVWGDYRFFVIADASVPDGLASIDLGAGHSSSSESLCGRVISALKSSALLNESVGAGYLERNWPPALKESGAWPLVSLRQSFLNGSLTRLVDPDAVLCRKIVEFVDKGDFGLGSGRGSGRPIRAGVVPGDRLARGRHVRGGRLPADPRAGRAVERRPPVAETEKPTGSQDVSDGPAGGSTSPWAEPRCSCRSTASDARAIGAEVAPYSWRHSAGDLEPVGNATLAEAPLGPRSEGGRHVRADRRRRQVPSPSWRTCGRSWKTCSLANASG